MFRRTLFSALAVIAFATPAASQTITTRYPSTTGEVRLQVPPAAPANESAAQRQRRYEAWRAANPDIEARLSAYVTAVRAQAAPYSMPTTQMRERLRTERFADIVTASAAISQTQRDEAHEIVGTAAGLLQAEQYDAASLLLTRALRRV